MAKEQIPVTPAILFMKKNGMAFTLRPYRFEEHGGTRVSARELGVEEHLVIKTLVMEDDRGEPLVILMYGDRQVSTKSLARLLGVKAVVAEKLNVGEDQVTEEAKFVEDLGADSLDQVELIMALEDEFELKIPEEDAEKLTTVGSAVDYVLKKAE